MSKEVEAILSQIHGLCQRIQYNTRITNGPLLAQYCYQAQDKPYCLMIDVLTLVVR